jgi:hypothetical protein
MVHQIGADTVTCCCCCCCQSAHDEHDELPAYEYDTPAEQNAQVEMLVAPVTLE